MKFFFVYSVLISALGIALTVYDKAAAKRRLHRIPERALILIAALGSALPMFLTMEIIRHKTRHRLFMIGLPLIFIVQIVTAFLILNR